MKGRCFMKRIAITLLTSLLMVLPFAHVTNADGIFITTAPVPVYYPIACYALPSTPVMYAPPAPYYYTMPGPVVYSAPAVYAAPMIVSAPVYGYGYGWGYHHHWH